MRSTPTPLPPETIESAPMRPLAALKVTLDGQASRLLPRSYNNGDGRTRIELAYNGVVLGVGVHADVKEAAELAAHDALQSDWRGHVLAGVRSGKY